MGNIIVYGRGKTGLAVMSLLNRQGKTAVFYDDKQGFDLGGKFQKDDTVITSPGVLPSAQGLTLANGVGCKVVSETEYCFDLCKGRCVSVTGTNGKTTTCEMIFHILSSYGKKCHLLGNGGVPFSSQVLDVECDEVVVLESSSFQLANCNKFSPYISVFTSLAQDHVDYHGSFADYVRAKLNNFVHQTEGYAIFNADDDNVLEVSSLANCDKLYYSAFSPCDCYYDGQNVACRLDKIGSARSDYIGTLAKHNILNVCGAVLCCVCLGVPLDFCVKAVESYKFLPHRLQVVGKLGNVSFVDDSKATNVHATVSALDCYANQNVALILGGSDKNIPFDDIFVHCKPNVKLIVASGQTAQKIISCAKVYGFDVIEVADIKSAVWLCYEALRDCGGVVLMSNACASFDKFSGYEQRGDYFVKTVGELIAEKEI